MNKYLKHDQSGVAHIVLIVLGVVVTIFLAGTIGYGIYRHSDTSERLTISEVQQASGCTNEEPLPDECQDSDPRTDAELLDDEGPLNEL